MGAVHALHAPGRADAAQVSVGDFLLARTLRPGVTLVDHDPHRSGITATGRLPALLDGAGGGSGEELIVQTELVIRGSGELSPVGMSR